MELSVKRLIQLTINGEVAEVAVEPTTTLLHVLREDLGLTGTKEGCSVGDCGACTVLLDGKPVASCLTLAVEVRDREVLTIEGLSKDGELHPLQRAFIDHFAVQCGFCTPGMILSAKALLDKNPHASEEDVRQAISGNLCRCTGYIKIVEAVLAAAESLRTR